MDALLLLRCDDCGALSCFGCARKVEDGARTTLLCGACGSNQVRDTLANNWSDFPGLQSPVPWQTADGTEPHIEFKAEVGGERWAIRMNDFPDEPMYTLMVGEREVIHFDDWPTFWGERPAFPKARSAAIE